MNGRATILTYHRVLPTDAARAYPLSSLVTPEPLFRDQLRWLSSHARVLTVAEAMRDRNAWRSDTRPLVCITFDDGFADNLLWAQPVLREQGLKATFFMTTGPILRGGRLWFDLAAEAWSHDPEACVRAALAPPGAPQLAARPTLREWMGFLKTQQPEPRDAIIASLAPASPITDLNRMMNPDEVRLLLAAGHEIAAHSVTHPILPPLDASSLHREVTQARADLMAITGVAPVGFCYPNGDHDDRVIESLRRAEYAYACTTTLGRNDPSTDPFRLRRVDMNPARVTDSHGRHSEAAFRAEISLLHGVLR